MGSSPSYPAPPDPMKTAQAQAQMNTQTAIAQQKMNMINQVTPYGTLTYKRVDSLGAPSSSSPSGSAATGGHGNGTNLYDENGRLLLDSFGNFYGDPGIFTTTNEAGTFNHPVQVHDANNNSYNLNQIGGIGHSKNPYSLTPINGAPSLPDISSFGSNGFSSSGGSGGGGGNINLGNGLNYNDIPQYEAVTSLSPEEQRIFDLNEANRQQLAQTGNEQLAKVRGILNTPFDLNSAIGTQQSDIARTLLDPVWNQREQALRTQLANQGITQGSEAYTNALRDFGMQRDNAYNSALLSGRSQAEQEALTQRNQPLNEISALLGGSQVQMPSFVNTPSVAMQSPDYMGAVQSNYNAQVAQANARAQSQNAMLGGLFGLLSAPLGGLGMSI